MGLQVGLQTGVTFLEKWGYKSGVKRITIALVGKLPLLLLYVQETYPFSTSVFGAYTLLYIVYRGFLVYFYAFQGEGEHLRGVFGGVSSSRSRENDTHPGGGYRTGLLQTDDTSNESDGVEI